VFAAEHAKAEHLRWCELRAEFGIEVSSCWLAERVPIVLLHAVIDRDGSSGHWVFPGSQRGAARGPKGGPSSEQWRGCAPRHTYPSEGANDESVLYHWTFDPIAR